MNMMVIVWVGLGLMIFALSFILPKRKEELDEDTKKFAGEQIRDILDKEIAGMQSKLDDVVSETIEESSSQTERALEKLTNEKIMAINEYSDTVIEDINNNHKEVLFLYDMLNDKHVTIRNTVTEVEKTMGEVTQTAKDIEISAKEAAKEVKDSEEAVKRASDITNRAEKAAQLTAQNMEMDVRHIVEDMIRNRVEETMEKTAVPMIQERVDEILEDAALFMEQQPKILVDSEKASVSGSENLESKTEIPPMKSEKEMTQTKAVEKVHEESEKAEEVEFVQGIAKNAPQIVIEGEDENNLSYYVVEPEKKEDTNLAAKTKEQSEPKKISEIDMAPEEIRELERAVALEVMQGIQKAEKAIEDEKKETPKKSAEESTEKSRSGNILINDQEGRQEEIKKKSIESEPKENVVERESVNDWLQEEVPVMKEQSKGKRNNNEKILSLHKAGMSHVAIAKELGLGIGEVKLVIDLFKGM